MLGPNHVDIATSLNNLGLVFKKTGNYDKAIELHEKAKEIRKKKTLGTSQVVVAKSVKQSRCNVLWNWGISQSFTVTHW